MRSIKWQCFRWSWVTSNPKPPKFLHFSSVAMAMSLDKWKYATDPSSARNALSYGKECENRCSRSRGIRWNTPVLATLYLTFTNEPCQLWSYWTEFQEIFTQYTDIICAVNTHIEVAISCSISECQSDENAEFAISVQQILRYLFRYLLSNHYKLR